MVVFDQSTLLQSVFILLLALFARFLEGELALAGIQRLGDFVGNGRTAPDLGLDRRFRLRFVDFRGEVDG